MSVSAQASPDIESATEVAIAGEDIAALQYARGEWEGTACCSLKRDWGNWKWMQDTSVSAFWKAIVARSCFQFSSVQQMLSVLQENEWNINSFKVQTCLRKACKSIPSSKATEDCIGHCSGKMKKARNSVTSSASHFYSLVTGPVLHKTHRYAEMTNWQNCNPGQGQAQSYQR